MLVTSACLTRFKATYTNKRLRGTRGVFEYRMLLSALKSPTAVHCVMFLVSLLGKKGSRCLASTRHHIKYHWLRNTAIRHEMLKRITMYIITSPLHRINLFHWLTFLPALNNEKESHHGIRTQRWGKRLILLNWSLFGYRNKTLNMSVEREGEHYFTF